MKEAYIQMRLANKIDLSLFYQFYIAEYPNIPKTSEKLIKDMVGVPYMVEIPTIMVEGIPHNYIFQTETIERELIGFQQFAQAFSIYFQSRPNDLLDYVDRKLGLDKIEDIHGNLIYMN